MSADGAGAELELEDELPVDGELLGAVEDEELPLLGAGELAAGGVLLLDEDDEVALVAGGLSLPQAASANAAATATSNSLFIQVPLGMAGGICNHPGFRAGRILAGPA